LNKSKRYRIGFARQVIKERLYNNSVKSFRKLSANPLNMNDMCLFITYDSMLDNMLNIFGVKNEELAERFLKLVS
jgi:hypothetical protein